jgi:PAS domain S-box-containing protein
MGRESAEILKDPARLDALWRSSLLDTPAEATFDRLTRLVTKVLHVPVALVSLVTEDRQFFKSCVGLPEPWASARQTPLTHSFCQHVVNANEPLLVRDAREHALVKDNRAIADLNVIAYAGVPLVTPDGFVLGSLCAIDDKPRVWTNEEVGILNDLAASVMAEVDLIAAARKARLDEQAQRTVREALAHDALLLANVRDSVIVTDLEGIVTFWNEGATKLFGWTAAEMTGRPLTDRLPEHSSARADVANAIREIIGGREFEGEWLDYRKDESRVWIEARVGLLRDTAGTPVGVMGVSHDICQRKQADEEIRRAKDAAESANAAKDKLLAVLSHELRTPLSPVMMTAGMMEADPNLPPEFLADVQMIRRNVELEVRLIDDLLDVTRVIRGKLELHREIVNVHTLLDRTFEMCQSDLHNKGQRLVLDLRAERHYADADPARVQQVLWNVVKNAVKFTPQTGRITVATSDDPDGTLRIDVIDTGAGIDPNNLSKIFNAFEQEASVTRQFGGLGLGLSISKALIELHGGTITAHSDGKGRGSTFTITLPTTGGLEEPTIPAPVAAGASNAGHPCLKILLVEDHESTVRAMTRLLRALCHEVTSAGTVAAAVERATAEQFDVLICDLGLPDGSGLDVMRQVKPRYPVKGIALTGYGMEDDIRQSRAAGFDHHLVKPVTLDKLKGTLHEVGGEPFGQ